MRKLVFEAGLADRITLDSAGTGSWHSGELPDPRTREAAAKRGIELTHLARQFVAADLERFDLIIAMDRGNKSRLGVMIGTRTSPQLRLLRSFDPTAPEGADIPDPFAGEGADFEHVLDLCEQACRGLLEHAREKLKPVKKTR